MTDPQPQDQPQPESGSDWNEVGVKEIEQALNSAADLAYELAGDIGTTKDQPKYRDASGLESIETTLDVELKQLEHLVDRTQEELGKTPPPTPPEKGSTAAVPDFMSEFLSDEPVKVLPEPRPLLEATKENDESSSSQSNSSSASTDVLTKQSGQSEEPVSKPGLIGVGTLGRREKKQPAKPVKVKTEEPARLVERAGWSKSLETSLYLVCDGAIQMLEVVDRPLARMNPSTRRALSVTAIAAFCTCLLMFVLSLLFS